MALIISYSTVFTYKKLGMRQEERPLAPSLGHHPSSLSPIFPSFPPPLPPSARVAPKATAAAIRGADTKPEWDTLRPSVRPSALLPSFRPNQTAPLTPHRQDWSEISGPSFPSWLHLISFCCLPRRRTVMVMGAEAAAAMRATGTGVSSSSSCRFALNRQGGGRI